MINIFASISIFFIGNTFSVNGMTCKDFHGFYRNDNGAIYICEEHREDKFVLYHELGHKYWFEIMTEKQKERWREIYFYPPNEVEEYANQFALYWFLK